MDKYEGRRTLRLPLENLYTLHYVCMVPSPFTDTLNLVLTCLGDVFLTFLVEDWFGTVLNLSVQQPKMTLGQPKLTFHAEL